MLDVSGQLAACLDLAGGPISQGAGVEIDVDFPAPEVPANELLGQRIFDVALEGAAQWLGNYHRFWAESLDRLDVLVKELKRKEGRHGSKRRRK